jgi:hypothetical protein
MVNNKDKQVIIIIMEIVVCTGIWAKEKGERMRSSFRGRASYKGGRLWRVSAGRLRNTSTGALIIVFSKLANNKQSFSHLLFSSSFSLATNFVRSIIFGGIVQLPSRSWENVFVAFVCAFEKQRFRV